MAVKLGRTSPVETHDSREVERLRKGRVTTVRYNGDYAALKAMQPKPGHRLDGGKVQTSLLRRLQGGSGLLEYTIQATEAGEQEGSEPGATIEIEMAQTERPILCRREFQGYADAIDLWRNSPDELRSQFKYRYYSAGGEEQEGTLGTEAQKAARLILRGIESYLVFHPVVTITTKHDSRPVQYASGIGRIGNPTRSGYPGGYEYLKTADRLSEQTDGTWTRVEQWTGAKAADGGWEHDLYEGADS